MAAAVGLGELTSPCKAAAGWTLRKLSECASVNTEQLSSKTDPDFLFEYLDLGAIERAGAIGRTRKLRFDAAPSRARRIARAGDILVSTVRPYLRKFGRLRQAPDNLVVSTGYAVVRPADGVDGDFLYQHVLSDQFVEFLERRMVGSNYPAVGPADVEAYQFALPPHAEQRKIAAILSSIDDTIEKTLDVLVEVRFVKRVVMLRLMTLGLPKRRPFEPERAPWQRTEEWPTVPLVEVCQSPGQYGANVRKSDFVAGGVRYIRITDINDDGTLKDSAVGIGEREAEKYLLSNGDLLFARSGSVGRSYLHREMGVRCAFAGYLVRFRTNRDLLLPDFLKEYVNTDRYWAWVARRRHASAQPNINAAEFGQLPVPCPCLSEQKEIVGIARSFDGAIRVAERRVNELRGLKQSLMSSLLGGRVRVESGGESS